MEYEIRFEETRALTKGRITLQFVHYIQRPLKCRCGQKKWTSADAKRLSDLSFQYFKIHGYNEGSGSTSYWVDIHGNGLAIKIEASDTKLRPDRAVQYRMLLRRSVYKDTRLRNERSSPPTQSPPRGLLRSLDENHRVIPTEETSDFYLPLTKVSFIAVPPSFYLTLSMPPAERQRISSQLPENCSVKIPLIPFSAAKVQARGTGERFIGLLFDEESVAFYMTVDEAERRGVIWENEETLTVHPPIAMRHIISRIYRPTLQKKNYKFVTSESLLENEPFQSKLKCDESLSIIAGQNRTSFILRISALASQIPPTSPPVSRVDPQVVQNLKRASTLTYFKGGRHFSANSGPGRWIIGNPSSSLKPAARPSQQLPFEEKCSIQRYRSFLLSKDFASRAGKIWIIAFPIPNLQNAIIGVKFCFRLTVYSSSAKPRFFTFSSAFKLSFEDLLSIKEILTPDCFPRILSLPHVDLDNTFVQIHTLVRSILYVLVSSSVGYKVPLSPEERRILGYRPTGVLRSIEYYTVDPVTAMIWVSTFYREIILSLFCNGKTRINENLIIFQPSLRRVFHCCTRNLFLSGQTADGDYRNDEVLNVLLSPLCHSPCIQRTGAVPPPRVILVKLPYKGGHGMIEYQSTRSDTESAPPDSLQKTPHLGKSRLPIHSIQFQVLRSLQPPSIRFWYFPLQSRYNSLVEYARLFFNNLLNFQVRPRTAGGKEESSEI